MSSTAELEKLITPVINNKVLYTVMVLFITLYGGLAAPKLPRNIANLFDNQIFKLAIIFVIAYTATKDTSIALMCAMGLLISLNTLTVHKINDKICKALESDIKVPSLSTIKSNIQTSATKLADTVKCIAIPPQASQSLPPPIPTPSAGSSSPKKENFSYMNDNLETFTLDSPSPFESNGATFASF